MWVMYVNLHYIEANMENTYRFITKYIDFFIKKYYNIYIDYVILRRKIGERNPADFNIFLAFFSRFITAIFQADSSFPLYVPSSNERTAST